MENKYWILILIAAIIVACVGTSLIFIHKDKSDQPSQVCPTCEYCEDCDARINYCFEKCKYGFPVVGWEDEFGTCLSDCFHPDYNIIKMDWGK